MSRAKAYLVQFGIEDTVRDKLSFLGDVVDHHPSFLNVKQNAYVSNTNYRTLDNRFGADDAFPYSESQTPFDYTSRLSHI